MQIMDLVRKNNTDCGNGAEVVLYQPDSSIHIEVLVEGETVWLTQQQMAELFSTTKQNVSLHINNIFREGELDKIVVVKESFTTTSHGAMQGKTQRSRVSLYNLDVIISVGYRVRSQAGTRFRIWATSILKQYLLQGYAINRQLVALQQNMDERLIKLEDRMTRSEKQIDFFVRTNQPPHEGVVFEGHLLEGREVAEALVRSAKREIILIDSYVGADTFHILETRNDGVKATVYTERVGANITALQADYEREYGCDRRIDVRRYRTNFHDRFLIVDDDVYHIGASLKDLGKRLFAFDKMGLGKELILGQTDDCD